MELPDGSWNWERSLEELIRGRVDAQGQALDGAWLRADKPSSSNVGKRSENWKGEWPFEQGHYVGLLRGAGPRS